MNAYEAIKELGFLGNRCASIPHWGPSVVG